MERYRQLVRDRTGASHVEIFPFDRERPLEIEASSGWRHCKGKTDREGRLLDRQLTREPVGAGFFRRIDPGGYQPDPRVILHIEITIIPQVTVPESIIRIHGSGIDTDVELARCRILRIEVDAAL